MRKNQINLLFTITSMGFLFVFNSCKEKIMRKFFMEDQSHIVNTVWEGVEVVNGENDIDRLEFKTNDSVGRFINSYTTSSDKYGGYEYGLSWFRYSIVNDSTIRIGSAGKYQDLIISKDGSFLKPVGNDFISKNIYRVSK